MREKNMQENEEEVKDLLWGVAVYFKLMFLKNSRQ